MSERFYIELPDGISDDDLRDLKRELTESAPITAVGSMGARGVDAQQVMLWAQTAGTVFATLGAALPVISKIAELVRKRGVKGARIKLPNGAELSLDEASVGDTERLLRAAGMPAGG
jgi:hypothetical protein